MAEIVHEHDDSSSGASGALVAIVAVILLLALLYGGWWLFVRQPAPTAPVNTNTDVNIETTTTP